MIGLAECADARELVGEYNVDGVGCAVDVVSGEGGFRRDVGVVDSSGEVHGVHWPAVSHTDGDGNGDAAVDYVVRAELGSQRALLERDEGLEVRDSWVRGAVAAEQYVGIPNV